MTLTLVEFMLQNKFGLAREDTVGGYRDLMLSVIFTEPRYW